MTPKKTKQRDLVSGFSLIEMMIAMTIGLMVIGALTAVIISAGGTGKANDRNSELQTNGRYALDTLKRDIQLAGYYGLTGRGVIGQVIDIGANDCYAFFASNLSQRVWGSNDGVNTFAAKCIPAASYAGSDMLVLRYVSLESAPSVDTQATAGFNTAGMLYFRSAFGVSALYQAPASPYPSLTATPQNDHRVEVHIYYVNPNSVGADGIPSLHRVVFDATGAMVDELVVSGVQNMQVQYGVSDAAGTTQYLDAQNVNAGVAAATDSITPVVDSTGRVLSPPNPWGKVNALRIWLLMRNSTPDKDVYTDTNTYTLGDQTLAAAKDRYRRQLFSSTIQLRN